MTATPFAQSNIILYCERFEAALHFYRHVLALPANVEKSWFVEFRLTPTSFVSVAHAPRTSIPSSGGRGITLTLQSDDIDAVRQRLVDAGIDAGEAKKHPWGALGFFCRDPEGHRIEIWKPL